MNLLDKLRMLLGAVVHKPLTPNRDKPEPTENQDEPSGPVAADSLSTAEAPQEPDVDTERVADLIAARSPRKGT